jgi:hypothetical protein
LIMQSPDDYDFDDPRHQADLDGIIERLLARHRPEHWRMDDPLTRMIDIVKRIDLDEEASVRRLRNLGWSWRDIGRELNTNYTRLFLRYGQASTIKQVVNPLSETLKAASSVESRLEGADHAEPR